MRIIRLAAVLLIMLPAAAQADSCNDMFNGFGADMDKLAAAYERMTTNREMCTYGRDNAIPTRRRIVNQIVASHCPNTAGPLKYSRDRLQQDIASTEDACRKAGM